MNRRSRIRGVTLIEVLIAIVVLAVGLLWMAGMQTAAVRQTYLAYQYSQAGNLAVALAERMKANPQGVRAGSYNIAADATPAQPAANCAGNNCTPQQLAAWDLADWYTALSDDASAANVPSTADATLPDADFSVICLDATCTDTSQHLITVYWNPSRDPAVVKTTCDPDDEQALRCMRLVHQP